jgi:hypothetical protein
MKIKVEVELTMKQIAEAFCEMDSGEQAMFFIECAGLAQAWGGKGEHQWRMVGASLAGHTGPIVLAHGMIESIQDGLEGEQEPLVVVAKKALRHGREEA